MATAASANATGALKAVITAKFALLSLESERASRPIPLHARRSIQIPPTLIVD